MCLQTCRMFSRSACVNMFPIQRSPLYSRKDVTSLLENPTYNHALPSPTKPHVHTAPTSGGFDASNLHPGSTATALPVPYAAPGDKIRGPLPGGFALAAGGRGGLLEPGNHVHQPLSPTPPVGSWANINNGLYGVGNAGNRMTLLHLDVTVIW